MTDVTDAQTLGQQSAWATAASGRHGHRDRAERGGHRDQRRRSAVNVPVTVPAGHHRGGAAFGQSYGGQLSAWTTLPPARSPPSPRTSPRPSPAPTPPPRSSGALHHHGDHHRRAGPGPHRDRAPCPPGSPSPTTATARPPSPAPRPPARAAATRSPSRPPTPPASDHPGLHPDQRPGADHHQSRRRPPSTTGVAGTYTVTTTGYPAATVTESGHPPAGLTFTANGNGTATIAGTTAAAPPAPTR